jgi:lipoprotein-releasing system permease protein
MIRLVAIISSVFLIAGAIFPWLGTGPMSAMGIYHFAGDIVLIMGLLGLILSIYDVAAKESRFGLIFLIIGISSLIISTLDFLQLVIKAESYVKEFIGIKAFINEPGRFLIPEFILILIGALGTVVTGIIIYNNRDITAARQGWTAGFIANRIAFKHSAENGRSFSRFVIRLSIVATVISVAVMIVTLAFTNGFQETVSQKVFSFWGHIRVQYKQPARTSIAEEEQIEKNDTIVNAIKQNPAVASIHPFATKYAILKTKDEMESVLMKGLDNTYDTAHLKQFFKQGRWIHYNDSSYSREIILSSYTAERLKLKLNDKIMVGFLRRIDSVFRRDKLTVVGIYKTSIEDYDKTFAIGDLKLIQRLNSWDQNEIGGYEIFLHDYTKMDDVANQLYYDIDQFPPDWDTKSIKDIYPNIFDWLNMQNVTRNVLISIMIFVAVVNLITCLIILVLERVRMIGILKALGAKDWTVQTIFLRYSTFITFFGILLGVLFGLGICWLQKETGFIKLKEEAYYMSEAAVKIVWWQIGLIIAGTFTICFLVLMIPSVIVKMVRPVKAIRFR